eukprot:jgi/Psemu1/13861/gm1.13861_g
MPTPQSSIDNYSEEGSCDCNDLGDVSISSPTDENSMIRAAHERNGAESSLGEVMNHDDHDNEENGGDDSDEDEVNKVCTLIPPVLLISTNTPFDDDGIDDSVGYEDGEATFNLNSSARFPYVRQNSKHDSINSGLSVRMPNQESGIGIPMGAAGNSPGGAMTHGYDPSSLYESINTGRIGLSLPFSSGVSSSTAEKPLKQQPQHGQKQMRTTLRNLMFSTDILGPKSSSGKDEVDRPIIDNTHGSNDENVAEDDTSASLDIDEIGLVSDSTKADSFYDTEEPAMNESSSTYYGDTNLSQIDFGMTSDKHVLQSFHAYERQIARGTSNIVGGQDENNKRKVVHFAEFEDSYPKLMEYDQRLHSHSKQDELRVLDIFDDITYNDDDDDDNYWWKNSYNDDDEESSFDSEEDEDEDSQSPEKKIPLWVL